MNENGEVFSNKTGILKPLKIQTNNRNYLFITSRVNGKQKNVSVHRLVAETFIGDIVGKVINHKDGNVSNNHVSNLEIVSQKDNIAHSFYNGLTKKGEKHSRAKISDNDLKSMIKEIQNGLSTVKASKKYNLSQSYVSKVMRKGYRKRYMGYIVKNVQRLSRRQGVGCKLMTLEKGSSFYRKDEHIVWSYW